MYKKTKVTKELLEIVETYMGDRYTQQEMFKELNLCNSLKKDKSILRAIENGRIELVSTNDKYSDINDLDITEEEYRVLRVKAKPLIDELDRKKQNRVEVAITPAKTYLTDFIKRKYIFEDDVQEVHKKVIEIKDATKKGNYDYLIETLISNTILMQTRIENLNHNITREDVNSEFINKLSYIQIKMLEEIRKTTLTIQQLVEPKRTVFVKGDAINQQNNQINFQKNQELENKLSLKEIKDAKLLERGTQEKAIKGYS